MDDNEKVSAIPEAENKGEIAYNQDIIKLTNLKQAALKENISVQELQKIKEKIFQVIQDAENANSQQQIANYIVTGLPFEKLPQNVKDYYESYSITATTTTIGDYTFTNKIDVFPKDFTIPNSITKIGSFVFTFQTLPKGFALPPSVTSLGNAAFFTATLPDGFTLPNSITSIEDAAFESATLPKGFAIPSSVTSIGTHAFFEAKLPDGTSIQNPPLPNGNDLTLNSNGTWS